MRKIKQAALVVAAVGGLVSLGASSAVACPNHDHDAGQSQPDQAQPEQEQATTLPAQLPAPLPLPALLGGVPAPAPAPAPAQEQPAAEPQQEQAQPAAEKRTKGGETHNHNNYKPAQECSPQTIVDLDVPIGVLGKAETNGFHCEQFNPAFNA